MANLPAIASRFRPTLSFVLLASLLAVLWLAGGASRADVAGQVVARAASWIALIVALLFCERPVVGASRPLYLLLGGAMLLAILQLVPLPPAIWQSLPGRSIFVEAAAASGQAQPWRPWAIVPGGTLNALSSLIVPAVVLLLATDLSEVEHRRLAGLLLAMVVGSMLLGLLQFSGAEIRIPLINSFIGEPSGNFANRNHFALFLAIGCLLAATWAFASRTTAHWRIPVAIGLLIVFMLTILASGSRAGLIVGGIAIIVGPLMVRRNIRRLLKSYPRWILPAAIASAAGLVIAMGLVAVLAGRAVSISRLASVNVGQDMRGQGLPVVLDMIREYFPAGSGLGGFDPVFRVHEPVEFLGPNYFNHAHNDFLEIALDGGVFGLSLLLAALIWWFWTGMRSWIGEGERAFARLGSAIIFLILIASLSDYPARTPIMMAVLAISGVWLARGATDPVALPTSNQHL